MPLTIPLTSLLHFSPQPPLSFHLLPPILNMCPPYCCPDQRLHTIRFPGELISPSGVARSTDRIQRQVKDNEELIENPGSGEDTREISEEKSGLWGMRKNRSKIIFEGSYKMYRCSQEGWRQSCIHLDICLTHMQPVKWFESTLMACYSLIASYMQSDCIMPKRRSVPDKLST